MYRISVVVPVYNEEGNVRELHKEIMDVCEKEGYEYEIIFINDGSSDRTDEICRPAKPHATAFCPFNPRSLLLFTHRPFRIRSIFQHGKHHIPNQRPAAPGV